MYLKKLTMGDNNIDLGNLIRRNNSHKVKQLIDKVKVQKEIDKEKNNKKDWVSNKRTKEGDLKRV